MPNATAAAPAAPPKGAAQEAISHLAPKDKIAEVVRAIVNDSYKSLSQISLLHQEALINSMGLSPASSFVTADAPYGQNPSHHYGGYSGGRKAIGDIVSPFTSEQVNSITTRLVAPLIGQREVLYVEAQGIEDLRKAAVRETLFERAIRSPYTTWADLCWRTMRDTSVRSRAYWEVRPLKVRRMRRTYEYNSPEAMKTLLDAGLAPEDLQMLQGTLRTSKMEPVTLWDGPVIAPLTFGAVHKERSETLISDKTLCVVIEREMPWQQFLIEGKALFPAGSEVPFSTETARSAATAPTTPLPTDASGIAMLQYGLDRTTTMPKVYEPVRFWEFRGINPVGSPEEEWIAWVVTATTIGAKVYDGSGSCINIVEWCWDPVNGMASSASPAMTLLSPQEMLSLLMNCGLNAAVWDSVLSGGINTDRVNDPNQVRHLHPAQFFNVQGTNADGDPLIPIQLGKNAAATLQFIGDMENRLRLATGGTASVVGQAPPGVSTLGEYAGIAQGAMDRIGTQLEINADSALRRTYGLVQAIWRDGITTDDQLQQILGQQDTTYGATLEDLEGDLDVIPMASRYHQVRKAEVDAISQLLDRAAADPQLMARIKPAVYDDYAYAVAGPKSRRWFRSEMEMMQMGMDPAALQQQAVAGAAAPGRTGQPSPPKEQPTTGAEQVNQQGATV